jgi:gentisate 1,2-dioxygenase
MKTEPMALATGIDVPTVYQLAPEVTAQEKRLFHQANNMASGTRRATESRPLDHLTRTLADDQAFHARAIHE